MKLLMLDSTYRRWLNSKGALAIDSSLEERFIGLTHNESIFFAEMSSDPFAPLESRNVDKLERFIRFYERHELTLAFQLEKDKF